MKNIFYFHLIFLCFSISFLEGQTNATEAQKLALKDISFRALNINEPQALAEVIYLPPEVALPFLQEYIWANRAKKGRYFDAARDTFLKFPNYEKPYAEKLAIATRKGYVDVDVLRFLELIATPKAAAVVAPYLFDYTESPSDTGHGLSDLNALNAGFSLGRMNLSDAPTKTKPGSYKGADYLAWRQWAIDKGYVPKTTNPALPEWMIHMNETPTPYIIPTPLANAPRATPIPTLKANPSPLPTAQKAQSSSSIFPIVAGVFLFLAVIAGIIIYRSK